jgi:hypothetical protein
MAIYESCDVIEHDLRTYNRKKGETEDDDDYGEINADDIEEKSMQVDNSEL